MKSQWPSCPAIGILHAQVSDPLHDEAETPTPLEVTDHVPQPGLHRIITIANFSCLAKLISVIAYVLRFIN
jgi:hypothetical protein